MQLKRRNVNLNYRPAIATHKQAKFRGLFQAAGFIRKVARSSIKRNKRPSPAGGPPHTQTGRIKNALRFEVNKNRDIAIIGAAASVVGPILGVMEAGGTFRGTVYEKRPTMKAAFQKAIPRLPEGFRLK